MDTLNNILSDIGNFSLVVFGFSSTLFTVLYSFILMRRENLQEISEKIKLNDSDPFLSRKKSSSIRYISRMKTMNRNLIFVLFSSFGFYIISMILKYLCLTYTLKKYGVIVLITLVLGTSIFVVYVILKTVKDYLRATKI